VPLVPLKVAEANIKMLACALGAQEIKFEGNLKQIRKRIRKINLN
jgi:hypothetical protein